VTLRSQIQIDKRDISLLINNEYVLDTRVLIYFNMRVNMQMHLY